jgi:oxygen-independent coproporphyrinogen III oxidase
MPSQNLNSPRSLYVHIPFCSHLCHYCDFTKMLFHEQKATLYLQQLLLEIKQKVKSPVETIFIGGGTPTALTIVQLEPLLALLQSFIVPNGEFTIECNVENTDEEKLRLFQRYGVNRLSFGVQSFDETLLKAMNRNHHQQDIFRIIQLAKDIGFKNINVDFIYDLPEQSPAMIQQDLNAFIALDVDHIATYALTIHPHTVFGIQKVKPAPEEMSRQHYELILNQLRIAGYERYEVSNFARQGKQSLHNQTYWNNEQYYGCGLGASGYEAGVRYVNTKNLTKYSKGEWLGEQEVLSTQDRLTDFFMLKLRMQKGFSTHEFEREFGHAYAEKFGAITQDLTNRLLVNHHGEHVSLTDEGFLLLDYVVLKLLTHPSSPI